MEHTRWVALMTDDSILLSNDEIDQGWHFCVDWDGLLIGPGDAELEACYCRRDE